MKVYNNKLYVGGDFTDAGGIPSNYVAMWDGTNWLPITTDTFSGPSITVEAIEVYHDTLIIGGNFTAINGNTAIRKIAKYNATLTGINSIDQTSFITIYPNPAQSQITIEFELPKPENTAVEITNVLGQTLKTIIPSSLKGQNKLELGISALPPGIYILQLKTEDRIVSKKFIKQ